MSPVLNPTLWRTCRVLANETRLAMLEQFIPDETLTVTALAEKSKVGVSAASQFLRALEARGILQARREGRFVKYRLNASPADRSGLATILRNTFRHAPDAATNIFRLCTAFTHPRRIEIYQLLRAGPANFTQLRLKTKISDRALSRHLDKLVSRGFVTNENHQYVTREPATTLGRRLAEMAMES